MRYRGVEGETPIVRKLDYYTLEVVADQLAADAQEADGPARAALKAASQAFRESARALRVPEAAE